MCTMRHHYTKILLKACVISFMKVGSIDRLHVLSLGSRGGSGVVSVIQIVQRLPMLLTTFGLACGNVAEPGVVLPYK